MRIFLLVVVALVSISSASAQERCSGLSIMGGVDVFPFSLAKPFQWSDIQGIWKVSGSENIVMKFRVIRQTEEVKQLEVQVYDRVKNCSEPFLKGKGFVSTDEPNIIRMSVGGKLLTFAWFYPADLEMNPKDCGESVLVANFIDLNGRSTAARNRGNLFTSESSNMMLKKITSSLYLYCRKNPSSL